MMMVSAVGARTFPTRDPVMEMAPMGRRHILGIDAEHFDRVDRFQNTLDFGPTGEPEQDFAARPYARDCGDRRSGFGGAQNVDTGGDRSMVIRRPSEEGKNTAWGKRNDAPAAVNDAFLRDLAKPDPTLDASLLPIEFNFGEIVHPPHLLAIAGICARTRSRGVSVDHQTSLERGTLDVAGQFRRDVVRHSRGE
jgi:hypothetical protein